MEQHIANKMEKSFILLLHYSPSNLVQARCYPALFLGGWEHVFLDSVGSDTSAFVVDRLILRACRDINTTSQDCDQDTNCVQEAVDLLLPRALSQLASQQFFYRDQSFHTLDLLSHRRKTLDKVLDTKIDDSTIGAILSEKFSAIWVASGLLQTTRVASEALLCGTTQLSLSMSVHSALLQTFQAFLAHVIAQMNQWRNLDSGRILDVVNPLAVDM